MSLSFGEFSINAWGQLLTSISFDPPAAAQEILDLNVQICVQGKTIRFEIPRAGSFNPTPFDVSAVPVVQTRIWHDSHQPMRLQRQRTNPFPDDSNTAVGMQWANLSNARAMPGVNLPSESFHRQSGSFANQ